MSNHLVVKSEGISSIGENKKPLTPDRERSDQPERLTPIFSLTSLFYFQKKNIEKSTSHFNYPFHLSQYLSDWLHRPFC